MLLNDIFAGANAPMNTFCPNDDPARIAALQELTQIVEELRRAGVCEDLLMRLEAAENRVRAAEMEQMFCYAAGYGARLQRELGAILIENAE